MVELPRSDTRPGVSAAEHERLQRDFAALSDQFDAASEVLAALGRSAGDPEAVLTTIDNEPEHLAAARQAFADAKIPAARARFITGRAADVLPRMNEGSYDIVLIDADAENVIEYVEHGLRLVRPGGLVLVPRVLAGGRVADPVQRDAVTTAYRSLLQETQESPAVLAALSTVGEGLLQLARTAV